MNKFNLYISMLNSIKFFFIILVLIEIYLEYENVSNKKTHTNKTNKTKKLDKIKSLLRRVKFVFMIMMSLLIIYLFNPFSNRVDLINYETKLLIFIFGIILIITAEWQVFIGESVLLKKIQTYL
jgi:hypothetical protein